MPEQYEVVFTPDKASFKRTDGCIETKTDVMVATGNNVEIRMISLRNTGGAACTLEVTSYFEVVLATQAADVAHPAFGNLSVETGYQVEPPCIFAHRRSSSEQAPGLWLANAAIIEGEPVGDIQYETDRLQWLGRGRSAKSPIVIERNRPLSGTVGPVLDPAMSLRARVRVEPGKTARISFVVAVSENKEMLLALVERYKNADAVKSAFRLALTRSAIETGYLNLEAAEMELYQDMLRDILFISPMRKAYRGLILQNRGGQSSLWRYGISGDAPIVLVVLRKAERLEILYEVLKAHEYWRLMEIKADLVLLGEEECNYTLPLNALISDIVSSRQTHNLAKVPKDIFILDRNKVQPEDVPLLYAVARVILVGDGRTMAEQTKAQPALALPPVRAVVSTPKAYAQSADRERALIYYNGLGGFSPDGSEYAIRLEQGKDTPAPWVNVISNPAFGFTVSESGSGYTWAENSHENKLTPWSNDGVSDAPGEALYLTDADTGESWTATCLPIREEEPYVIRHGFGYSIFEHASHGIEQCLTLFVPVDEAVKLSLLQLKNASKQKRRLSLTYYIQPVLGVSEQNTAMHIQTRPGTRGGLLVENHYNTDFAGRILFIDTSVEARTVTGDRREFFGAGGIDAPDCLRRKRLSGALGAGFDPCAAMQVEIALEPGESREITFLMGLSTGEQQAETLASKYLSIENVRAALAVCRKFWTEKLGAVRVETPSGSMNLLLNGWLQYQVIACRLWARTGFYQSGGAFGFRDQLQDCLAIATAWPEAARAQILVHAGAPVSRGRRHALVAQSDGKGHAHTLLGRFPVAALRRRGVLRNDRGLRHSGREGRICRGQAAGRGRG